MQIPSVLDYGADPTGTTDSAPAIQMAVNAGGLLWVPPGDYRLDATVILTKPIRLMGSGAGVWSVGPWSAFFSAALALDLFHVNTDGASFEDLFFNRAGASNLPSEGNAILLGNSEKAPGQAWIGATIRHCRFLGHCRAVWVVHMQGWRLLDSDLYTCYGIQIENRSNADAGDANISDCTIMANGAAGATAAIYYISGGGLKVTNTKLLGGQYGFWQKFAGNSIGAQLNNLSIEGHGTHAIFLDPAGARIDGMTITGCHLDGVVPLITVGAIRDLVMTGTVLETNQPGAPLMHLLAGAEDVLINGNIFHGNMLGGGDAPCAIQIDPGASYAVGVNLIHGCTTGIA